MKITVEGVPVQQGSKTRWLTEETREKLLPWRARVSNEAAKLMGGDPPLHGAVEVIAQFTFPRPDKHYRGKARTLRADAPVYHTNYPDLDKLQRAIGDALAGVMIRDDKQIACWKVCKLYGENPCARIDVRLLRERKSTPTGRHVLAEEVLPRE